ncbi:MAG: DUF3857 domain-containing protein [Bacteroidia bacterium]|nr:DUF3857 domain-containing protein [Bacteroidia bacterium]
MTTSRSINSSQFLISFLICSILPIIGITQNLEEVEFFKKRFPEEFSIYTLQKTETKILNDKETNGIRIECKQTEEYLSLSDKTTGITQKDINYGESFETVSGIQAWTLMPDGKKYKKLKVDDYKEFRPERDGIFYDDIITKRFVFPGVMKGSIVHLEYVESYSDPHLMYPIGFHQYIPVIHAEYTVEFPSNVKVRTKIFGDTTGIVFSKKEGKGTTTLTWKMDTLKKIEREVGMQNYRYLAPQIFVIIDSYTPKNGKPEQVFPDLKTMYKWYYSHLNELSKRPYPTVKNLTDSLLKGESNIDEKIRKIFYFVQQNTKYIAFEDGLGGFVPRPPDSVLHRRYGDCKDKSSLLKCMFDYAGIESYLSWVATESLPYRFSEIFSQSCANHMIVSLRKDNQWYFIDGTASLLSFGMPTSMIQNSEVLIGISPDSFQIVKVPPVQADMNMQIDSIYITLDGKDVKGHGAFSQAGYLKTRLSLRLQETKDQKAKEILSSYLETGNNKFKLGTYSYSGIYHPDSVLKVKYDMTIPDYTTQIDDKIVINLNLDRYNQHSQFELDKRKNDYVTDYKFIVKHILCFTLPKGYTYESLPEPLDIGYKDLFRQKLSYKVVGNKIYLEKEYWSNYLILTKSEFPEWNKLADKLDAAYRQAIILKKI